MFYSFYYSTRRGPFEKMYGALFSLRGKKTGVTGWAQKKVRKRPTLPPPPLYPPLCMYAVKVFCYIETGVFFAFTRILTPA